MRHGDQGALSEVAAAIGVALSATIDLSFTSAIGVALAAAVCVTLAAAVGVALAAAVVDLALSAAVGVTLSASWMPTGHSSKRSRFSGTASHCHLRVGQLHHR